MKITLFDAFYTDLFDKENIIDSRFQVFLRNLIASLTTNNPAGVFTPQITALTSTYNTYFGNFETKSVNIAERVAKTSSLDTETALFASTVRSKYNSIAAVYPIGDPVYIEFFPHGMTEFSRLTRENVQSVSHRIATKATEYMSTLGGAPFALIFTNLETNITAAIGAQNTKKSVVKAITGSVITNRAPVEDATMKAMYAVGLQFWPNQVTCRSYYDFSLLFGVNTHPSVVKTGVVNANANALCVDAGIVATSVFTLKNKSDFPVTFFATHILNGTMVGTPIVVLPHHDTVITFSEFGAADMLFLYVKNETDYAGNWEVKVD
jgi:hypothetical protein